MSSKKGGGKAAKPTRPIKLGECSPDKIFELTGIDFMPAILLHDGFPMLKLTPRTIDILTAARKLGEKLESAKAPLDESCVLAELLAAIVEGRRGAPTAQTLIAERGDLLSVVAAGVATGLTQGEALRLAACVTVCLANAARGLKIKDRNAAALYFGEMYASDYEEPEIAYLDADLRVIEVRRDPESKIVQTAVKLGAQYVIVAEFDDGKMFDVKARTAALKKSLAAKNVRLLDHLVFDDGGCVALDACSSLRSAEPKFERIKV